MNPHYPYQDPDNQEFYPISTNTNFQHNPKLNPTVNKKKKKGSFLKGLLTLILVLVVTAGLLVFPFFKQSVLAMALDAGGLHKEAMLLDVITRKNISLVVATTADKGNIGNYLSSISTLDVTKPETCRQVWALNNLNLKSYSELGNDGFASIKTTGQYENWVNGKVSFAGQASATQVYLDGYVRGELNFQADKLGQKASTIQKEKTITDQDVQRFNRMGIVTGSINAQGQINTDNFYFNLDKISLGSNIFDAGFNFKYADQTYSDDTQKTSIKNTLQGLTELLDINSKDLLSSGAGQDLMQLYCQKILSIKVLSPVDKDFGDEQNKAVKNVRPIEIKFKDNLSDSEKDKGKQLLRNIIFDDQLKSSIKSKYEPLKKIYDNQKTLTKNSNDSQSSSSNSSSRSSSSSTGTTRVLSTTKEKTEYITTGLEKNWQENSLDKITKAAVSSSSNQSSSSSSSSDTDFDKVFSSKAEFEKYVDSEFNKMKARDQTTDGDQFIRSVELGLGLGTNTESSSSSDLVIQTKSTFYLDMSNQNFYGTQTDIEFKSKKSGNGNLYEEVAQEPVKIMIQNYNQRLAGQVEAKTIPDRIK
ncbi:MAG: hypothetical protein WCK98_06875 [bacterium]